jgi:hypothetical protein
MNTQNLNQHQMVLDVLRLCARQLLVAYDETLQGELYVAFERAAEACECLYALSTQPQFQTNH